MITADGTRSHKPVKTTKYKPRGQAQMQKFEPADCFYENVSCFLGALANRYAAASGAEKGVR